MEFVNIRSYDNYINANMQLGMLKEQDIHCYLKDEQTITIDPLLSPAIGGMKLMVAETEVERALQILAEAEAAWLQTVPCPACGSHSLERVVETKQFNSIWGKLKSLLANGQAAEVKSFFRCSTCNHVFTELPATV